MKFSKLVFFTLFLFSGLSAQSSTQLFYDAMAAYHNSEFAKAYQLFTSMEEIEGVDEEILSTSKYYKGESLFSLGQFTGAENVFRNFIEQYPLSNFREAVYYKLGVIYFQLGEYEKSREFLLNLLNRYPNSDFAGSAMFMVGESYSKAGSVSQAEEFLKNAVDKSRNNKYLDYNIYSLANLYEKNGDYENAVKYYDELLAYYGDSKLAPYAHLRIGVSYFKLKKYDNAILELTDPMIEKLSPELRTEANLALANSFFRLKEYESAADVFKKMMDELPAGTTEEELKYGLAWIDFQRHNYEGAYETFYELSKSGSDSIAVNSLYYAAESKRYQGEPQEAVKIYDEFIEKYPDTPLSQRATLNRGIVFFNKGDEAQSERYLISSVESKDDYTRGRALTLLGEINLSQKDYKSANINFKAASEVDALDVSLTNRALFGLAVSQFYLKNYDVAVKNLNKLYEDKNFETEKAAFYLAETYMAKDDYRTALRYYNKINNNDEVIGTQAVFGKAYANFNLKDFANAAGLFEEYIRRSPDAKNLIDAKLRLADCYYGTKRYAKASETYREVFQKENSRLKNDYVYYQYGQALFKSGKYNEAIQAFNNLQERYPYSKYADDTQYLKGWINFQQGQFRAAIDNYRDLFLKYPDSKVKPVALYSIGDSYFNLGKYDSAIVNYRRMLDDYPNTDFVYDAINGLQYAFLAKDQPENAVSQIDRFVAANPRLKIIDQVAFKKGDIYYTTGNYRMAKLSYQEFVEDFPNSSLVPNAYYWIGKSASNLGEDEEAKRYFRIVADQHADSEIGTSAIIDLGKLYEKTGDLNSAIELYDKVIESQVQQGDKIAELLFMKGMAEKANEDTAAVYETLNQILTYHEGTIFADQSKIELGILEGARGNFESAESLFRELAQKRLDDIGAEAQYLYGSALLEQKKYREAITAFVRVRSVYSNYDEYYTLSLLKLGDAYAALEDKAQASEMYKAVIKRHPKDEFGAEANKKLKEL